MPSRRLLLALYLPTLLLAVTTGMLVPTLPLFAASLESSYGLVGLILAGEAAGMLLGNLPAGQLLRVVGLRTAMGIGLLVVGAALLGLAASSGFWWVLLLRLAAGLGGAVWNVARHAFLASKVPLAGRGRAIALFGGVNRFGEFIGPVVGGVIAAQFGLRTTFAACAALAFVTLSLCLLLVEGGGPAGADRRGAGPFRTVARHRRVLAVAGTAQLLAQMTRAGRRVVIPLYAANALGLGVDSVGVIVGVAALVDASMFWPAGYVMDHWGRKRAIVPSFVLQALGLALVPLSGGFGMLLGAAALAAFGNGLGSGTMMTLGTDLAPSDALGEFLAAWRFIGDAGASGGPLLAGLVAELLDLPLAAAALAGVGLAAAGVFAWGVPETLRRPQPPTWRGT